MFVKFHERLKAEDKGFTLIELLVVVLIIAILAAIAIPVFLQQRKKGWRAQSQSSLKNAATAEESYATANNGSYTAVRDDLVAEGFTPSVGVTITPKLVGAGYCLDAAHVQLGEAWRFDSTVGAPVAGACP
ncbi:MAG: prepilin-type N-terminal cleavage/methylation domain-containing protein [Actinomycetota bacterium]